MRYMQYIKWFFALFFFIAFTGAVAAQTTPTTDSEWLADYWNNTTLSGTPALTRLESNIDHQWGTGSPAPGIVTDDRFSARWTRTITVPAGRYRFELVADDGARLWVNGRLFIDAWEVQPAETYTGEIYLPGGEIPLRLEYFENSGVATARLTWTTVDVFVQRWQGEYFNNVSLSGNPDLIRDDSAINFDWGSSSPAPDIIQPDTFSARWTRSLDFAAGQYRFTVTSDDGVRLWVGNRLLIDQWHNQAPTTYQREIALSGGQTSLRVDYYEDGGNAEIRLTWLRVHDLPQSAPGNTVDNTASNFVNGGPVADWQVEAEGYGRSLLWTRSSADAASPYNWGRWYPSLTAGVYEVSAYIPERFSTTSQARYWVSHSNGYTVRPVDQSVNGGSWVTLGTFEFEGSGSDFVSLADVTFESETRLVAYDAVRWAPISGTNNNTSVTVSPTAGSSGSAVTVAGSGFPPGQAIYLRLGWPNSEPFGQYGQAAVADDGTAAFTFVMPFTEPDGEPLAPGNELIVLLITQDGASGTAVFQLQ